MESIPCSSSTTKATHEWPSLPEQLWLHIQPRAGGVWGQGTQPPRLSPVLRPLTIPAKQGRAPPSQQHPGCGLSHPQSASANRSTHGDLPATGVPSHPPPALSQSRCLPWDRSTRTLPLPPPGPCHTQRGGRAGAGPGTSRWPPAPGGGSHGGVPRAPAAPAPGSAGSPCQHLCSQSSSVPSLLRPSCLSVTQPRVVAAGGGR